MEATVKVLNPKADWTTLSKPILATSIENYKPYVDALKKVFETLEWNRRESAKKVVLESTDMYCLFQPQNFFLQFRGSFMAKHVQPKKIIRLLAIQLSNAFNEIEKSKKDHETLFMISRVDICIDHLGCVPADIMQPLFDKKNKNCFSFCTSRYTDKDNIETSINLSSSKYGVICYRKDIQLLSERNLEKKKYYQELYPPDIPISRFELMISGVPQNREASILLYDESCDDDKFCNYILQNFLKTHAVRIINEKNKDSSTWEPDKNWEALFLPDKELTLPKIITIKKNDLKIGKPLQMNLSRHANAMIDAIDRYAPGGNTEEMVIQSYTKSVVDSNERRTEKARREAETKQFFKDLIKKSKGITLVSTDPVPAAGKATGEGEDTNGKKASGLLPR